MNLLSLLQDKTVHSYVRQNIFHFSSDTFFSQNTE
jgi:hypothetical protein